MEFGTSLTFYDLVILGLLLLLVARGLWLGFLKQIIGLVALYFGYIVASQYHDRLFPFLRDLSENPKVVFFAGYALLFIATYILAVIAGKGLGYVIKITMAGWFDRLLGGVLGFAKGILLVVLLHMVLGTVLAPENNLLRQCETCDELNAATGLALELIRNEEARKALMQQVPAISVDSVKDYLAPNVKIPVQTSAKTTVTAPGEKTDSPAPNTQMSSPGKTEGSSFWDDVPATHGTAATSDPAVPSTPQ